MSDCIPVRVARRHIEAGMFDAPPVMVTVMEAWYRELFLNHHLYLAQDRLKAAQWAYKHSKNYEDLYYLNAKVQAWGESGSKERIRASIDEVKIDARPDKADPEMATLNGKEMSREDAAFQMSQMIVQNMRDIRLLREGFQKKRKKKNLSGPLYTAAKETAKMVEAKSAIMLLKQMGATKAKEVKSYRRKEFKIDLTGWKYLSTLSDQQRAVAESWYVMGRFFWSEGKDWAGLWDEGNWELSVTAREPSFKPDEKFIKTTLAYMKDTLIHELVHLGQTVIQRAKNLKEEAGLPSKDIRTPGTLPSGTVIGPDGKPMKRKQVQHVDHDVEFYTNLSDTIREFQYQHRNLDYDQVMPKAEVWARRLTESYINPRKGAKAYSEFMKAIRDWASVKG